jgi:hypothetical protein
MHDASSNYFLLAVALIVALTGLGCSEPAEDQLHGSIGSGSGGPDIDGTQLMSHDWTDPDGAKIGTFQYDASAFLHYHPDPTDDALHVVANVAPEVLLADLADDGIINDVSDGEVLMIMTRTVGRPDTPCRFQAALLARDDGYEVKKSGDRKNAISLELHQVNLRNDKLHESQRFFCFQLKKPFGIAINVITADEAHQNWRQVFLVLNSVDKP